MWWSAYIEAASDDAEDPVRVEQLEQLADLLEPFSASVGGGGGHYSARLSVDADRDRFAADQALAEFARAREVAGLPAWPVVHLDLITEELLDAELAEPPFPEVVGVAEAAKLLGVTKQRLLQLTERNDFPAPMVRLAAGPVWLAASVRAFDQRWSRKPGRPAKAAGRKELDGDGTVVEFPPGRSAASRQDAVSSKRAASGSYRMATAKASKVVKATKAAGSAKASTGKNKAVGNKGVRRD